MNDRWNGLLIPWPLMTPLVSIGKPAAAFPRYLAVLLPFLLLVTAQGVAGLLDRGVPGRVAATSFLALFLLGEREIGQSTGKRFRLVRQAEFLAGEDPEWIVLHSYDRDTEFSPEVRQVGRPTYRRVRIFPHYGLSGFSWALYQR